jgi:hypothetical protein
MTKKKNRQLCMVGLEPGSQMCHVVLTASSSSWKGGFSHHCLPPLALLQWAMSVGLKGIHP